MASPTQQLEQFPAVCKNKECTNYQAFDLVELEDCEKRDNNEYVYICPECKSEIPIE